VSDVNFVSQPNASIERRMSVGRLQEEIVRAPGWIPVMLCLAQVMRLVHSWRLAAGEEKEEQKD
jgi:hypothetical protein